VSEAEGRSFEYIEATLDDIALANRLTAEVLGRSLDDLPPQTRRLLLLVDQMVSAACEREKIERMSDVGNFLDGCSFLTGSPFRSGYFMAMSVVGLGATALDVYLLYRHWELGCSPLAMLGPASRYDPNTSIAKLLNMREKCITKIWWDIRAALYARLALEGIIVNGSMHRSSSAEVFSFSELNPSCPKCQFYF
jgi:hypothetical protein